MIYLASSWKNDYQQDLVLMLRALGYEVYDFKYDEGANFHWSEVGVNSDSESFADYMKGMGQERAKEGFASDFNAMQKCDTCILVLPCGKSAHLELGWFAGQGKRTAIFNTEHRPIQPELMYKLVDAVFDDWHNLLTWLKLSGEGRSV